MNGGGYPFGDLLSLPLRHGGDQGVEEAAGGSRGVDRLRKRDEVGPVLLEDRGELEKLGGVSGEAGELGEDETGNGPLFHVLKHPLRLGVAHDGLPGDAFEVVHGDDGPALGFGVHPATGLVVLGALAAGLGLRSRRGSRGRPVFLHRHYERWRDYLDGALGFSFERIRVQRTGLSTGYLSENFPQRR